jgi:hypothetical protein
MRTTILAMFMAIALSVATVPARAGQTAMTVYKSPTCGCCQIWATYMRKQGFDVTIRDIENMGKIKARFGIQDDLQACHTAVVGKYVVEGHMPVEAINALLAKNPEVKGISLPGMPVGSPGMPGPKAEPFRIFTLTDGTPELFMEM